MEEMQEQLTIDRRIEDRFDLSQVSVWLKNSEDRSDPKIPFRPVGSLVDFSSRGLGITTKEPLKKGDEVIVRIKYGTKEIHAAGTVVRRNLISGRDYEVGIELNESEREFLPKLIVSYCREQTVKKPGGIYFAIALISLIVGLVLGLILPKL